MDDLRFQKLATGFLLLPPNSSHTGAQKGVKSPIFFKNTPQNPVVTTIDLTRQKCYN
jgi:hypothetical protein